MISKFPYKLTIPLAFFVIAAFLALLLFAGRKEDSRLKEAEANYHAGERAKMIASRKQSFNKSLSLYQSIEEEYHPSFGSGKLYYDIGDTYFQLKEYSWAVLYYLRAKALMPRDDKVERNLAIAREKLVLSPSSEVSAFAELFFFHYYLSLPERLQLFFLFSLVALLFCSFYLWTKIRLIKFLGAVSLFLMVVMLFSVGYTRYISPVAAVLIKASDLYRDAGTEYAKLGEHPLPGGTMVQILDIRPDGKWLKVLSPKGDLGYAPQEAVRLVGPS